MKVGILGGGQLGRMLALAGHPLGLTCRVLDPGPEACAAAVAEHVAGEYDDFRVLYDFARGLDVVTYEFENVPVGSARWLAERLPVFPPPEALEVAQDRLAEKQFLRSLNVPVPRFAPVETEAEFAAALREIGLPAVLKTRRFGYDGKGQRVLRAAADAAGAWRVLGGQPLILEEWVDFERELSVVAVRGRGGETAFYPLVENHHRDGVLRRTVAPAPGLTEELQRKAEAHAARLTERLGYVGVLAVEWFERGGELWANEVAPRVHNSGHWTIEGAETSQFENHLRAVLGWPLGPTAPRGCAEMWNLIGWLPDPAAVCRVPGAHLHVYGKRVRPNRKVGHVTVRADSPARRAAAARALEGVLREGGKKTQGPHVV